MRTSGRRRSAKAWHGPVRPRSTKRRHRCAKPSGGMASRSRETRRQGTSVRGHARASTAEEKHSIETRGGGKAWVCDGKDGRGDDVRRHGQGMRTGAKANHSAATNGKGKDVQRAAVAAHRSVTRRHRRDSTCNGWARLGEARRRQGIDMSGLAEAKRGRAKAYRGEGSAGTARHGADPQRKSLGWHCYGVAVKGTAWRRHGNDVSGEARAGTRGARQGRGRA